MKTTRQNPLLSVTKDHLQLSDDDVTLYQRCDLHHGDDIDGDVDEGDGIAGLDHVADDGLPLKSVHDSFECKDLLLVGAPS